MCTEFIHLGDLLEFLIKNKTILTIPILLKIALSAVKGMAFLSQQGIIHRGF